MPCTVPLRQAEHTACALRFVRRAKVTTANGARFQPHLTLAVWDGETPPVAKALPSLLFDGAPFAARLALGTIGPFGTYEQSLFEV